MGGSRRRRPPHVDVERVRAVEVLVEVGGADVGVPQRQRVVGGQPEGPLGVLSEAVERRPVRRQRRGELQVPILEDERGERGEENVAGGAPGDGEGEGGGSGEREHEVGLLGGEDMAAAAAAAGAERAHNSRRLGGARDDGVGDFPSPPISVGDSNA